MEAVERPAETYNKRQEAAIIVAVAGATMLMTSVLVVFSHSPLSLLGVLAGALALILALKYPEIIFALFLTAGLFKADPRLSALNSFVDLTLVFGLLSIIGLAHGVMTRRIRAVIPPKTLLVPYLVIVILGTISLMYTPAPNYGGDKLLKFVTITSLALFLPFFMFQRLKSIRNFFVVFLLLATFMVLDTVSAGVRPGEIAFHNALGSSYIELGIIAGTALLIATFYFLARSRSILVKLLWLSFGLMMLGGILLSGGKGPLVELTISIATVFIYLLVTLSRNLVLARPVKASHVKTFAVLILLGILSISVAFYFSDYFSTTFTRMQMLREGGGDSVLLRESLYSRAAHAMSRFPQGLTGLGIGGFSTYYSGSDEELYPHNIFLELGSELGIVGFLAIVVLLLGGIVTALRNVRATRSHTGLLSITLLALLVLQIGNACLSGDINDNRLLFACVGLVYAHRGFIDAKT